MVFVAPKLGWIVGDSRTVLRTEDAGHTWQEQHSGTDLNLCSIRFLTPELGWVVGDMGIILHTQNGGHTWEKQTSGTDEQLHLSSVSLINS